MFFDDLFKDAIDYSIPISQKNSILFVRSGSTLFEITTNSKEIEKSLKCIYGAMIVNLRYNTRGFVLIKYCYFKESYNYLITRNGKFAFSINNFPKSVSQFDWLIMSDIVDYDQNLPIIHGSAVVNDGKAVICVGDSGSGKSTLSLLMGREGLDFISDDVLLVSEFVRGVPRAFCIAERLIKSINNLDLIKGFKRGKEYVYINPLHLNIGVNSRDVIISHVIFLKRSESENKLKHISPGMTLMRLVENLFDTTNSFKKKIDILTQSVENASGAELTWCDEQLAIKLVKEHIT